MIYVLIYLVDLEYPGLLVEELNIKEIEWSDKQSKFSVWFSQYDNLSAFLDEIESLI